MKERKTINVTIGANLKREREKAGFTQDQLSEMLGIGSKSLSAIERGTVGMSLTLLAKACTILSISSDSLLFDDLSKNDVTELSAKLERMSPAKLEIIKSAINNLLMAFAIND